MKILIYINKNCFLFQQKILEQILSLPNLKVEVRVSEFIQSKPKENSFFRWIDNRFPLYIKSPLQKVILDTESFSEKFSDENVYNYVINLTGTKLSIPKIKILTPEIDFEQWQKEILQGKNLTIKLVESFDDENKISKQLTFVPEKGLYNNRDKALYYFTFLFSDFFNDIHRSNIKEKNGEKEKTIFSYYFALVTKIFTRKITKKEFNWKIITKNNSGTTNLYAEKGCFWADPFPVVMDNEIWIFFEEMKKPDYKGHISAIKIDDEGKILEKIVVLEKEFHLSFPNVFNFENNWYILPEQSEIGRLDIYKSTKFPYQWEHCKTLIKNKKLIDPEILFYKGIYWLFCNEMQDYEYENNERLSIFYSENLLSDNWVAHPKNPVIIDKSTARNAGKIFEENGILIRAGQSSIHSYGESLSLRSIDVLSQNDYSESFVKEILPPKGFQGLHTYNKTKGLSIFDVLNKE